jgi:hypothetical protein
VWFPLVSVSCVLSYGVRVDAVYVAVGSDPLRLGPSTEEKAGTIFPLSKKSKQGLR